MVRKKRPKAKAFTIMVVPNGRDQVKSWQFPRWLPKLVGGLLIGATAALAYFGFIYFTVDDELARMHDLQKQNQRQAEEIAGLHQSTKEIRSQIEAVVELDRELKQLIGLEGAATAAPTAVSRSGLDRPSQPDKPADGGDSGSEDNQGSPGLSDISQELKNLQKIVKQEHESLSQLKSEVINRQAAFLALPNRWPYGGRITSEFGYRRSPFGVKKEFHNGVDIAAPYGAKVSAAGAGTVVYADWKTGLGRFVTIDHGNGYCTSYAHNSRLLVKKGDQVKKGQFISEVGSSGRSTGPHLHFMVEKDGTLIDPLTVLYPSILLGK